MPSNPPTVADLEAEVASRCAVALAEAGVYLRASDAGGSFTPAIRQGLRRGAKDVGLYLANPLTLTDADVARLSPFALEWVIDWGERSGLEMALAHWFRAVQKYQEALAPAPMAGGWLMEEKQNVRARIAELRGLLAGPYREPADPIVVANPFRCSLPGLAYYPPPCPDAPGAWEAGCGPTWS
jgi:hypothetical protein